MLAEEVSIPKKYADFSDVFSKKSAIVLPKHSEINEHVINLEPGKQLPYRPIYNLGLVELETLKTYIKTNLINRFIWSSKSPIRVSIFFIRKSDGNLRLYVDYRYLNNLTIKNRYLLLLISELLD